MGALVALLVVSGCFTGSGPERSSSTPAPRAPAVPALHPDLAEDVRQEFLHTYQSYLRLAGAHDELLPVSGTGKDFFAKGHPVQLTRIESLGTLYVMGFDPELKAAVDSVANQSFDIDANFQVFETIIRVVGGLLSGYHATHDARLLDRARDLTDRLMPAFEKSPTGMPYRYANLRTGEATGAINVLAEIGTNVVEFGDLSRLTGDPRYFTAAKKALKAVYDRRSAENLVGTAINVETGQWLGDAEGVTLSSRVSYIGDLGSPSPVSSTINPPVDSFYEYLFEGWYFLKDPDLLAWYNVLTDALLKKQVAYLPPLSGPHPTTTHMWFSSNEYNSGRPVSNLQSELASFYAGLLAQSGHVDLGRAYHDSWKAVLDEGGYRILPEHLAPIGYAGVFKGNQLRPEYVDAALLLWLVTNETKYVDRAVEYYHNMKATSRVANGYTVLTDVTTRPETQGDLTPAYWYAENMKYYFLMFGRPARFDYADQYMTTEGDVLRGFGDPR
jgi:mannosyl-oligosaccharide alpha-1,2-mannosidase